MSPNQDGSFGSRVGFRVFTNRKSAFEHHAHDLSTPNERVDPAELYREALDLWLFVNWDDLSPEVRDKLDRDSLSNGGRGANPAEFLQVDADNISVTNGEGSA